MLPSSLKPHIMLQSLLALRLQFRRTFQPFFFIYLLFLLSTLLPPLTSFSLFGGFSLLGTAHRPVLVVPHDHTVRPLRHLLHGKLPVPFQIALRLQRPRLIPFWRSWTEGHRERVAWEASTCLRGLNPAVDLVLTVGHRRHLESLSGWLQ